MLAMKIHLDRPRTMIRAGETYALPRSLSRDEAIAYWHGAGKTVFVAEEDGIVLGTYTLSANQPGGASHVANCGYVTAPFATDAAWQAQRPHIA